jgi:hypothetical protein
MLPMTWSPYEEAVLRAVARHRTTRTSLQVMLDNLARPLTWVNQVLHRIPGSARTRDRIARTVETAAERITQLAQRPGAFEAAEGAYARAGVAVHTWADIRARALEEQDRAVAQLPPSWVYGAVEGGVVGLMQGLTEWQVLSWLALAAGDVSATLWLGARDTALVAACYGFNPAREDMLPHLLAGMIPSQDWESVEFLGLKALLGHPWGTRHLLAQIADAWVRRMTLVLTDKELAVVVPVAGAVVNAGLNAAYLRGIRQSAQDYFRLLTLSERHGADAVLEALRAAEQALI